MRSILSGVTIGPLTISVSFSTSIILLFLSISRTFTFYRSRSIGAAAGTMWAAICFMPTFVFLFYLFGSRSALLTRPRPLTRISLSGQLFYFLILLLLFPLTRDRLRSVSWALMFNIFDGLLLIEFWTFIRHSIYKSLNNYYRVWGEQTL